MNKWWGCGVVGEGTAVYAWVGGEARQGVAKSLGLGTRNNEDVLSRGT